MASKLDDVIAALPEARQQRLEARTLELAALKQASQTLDALLASAGIDTEAVVAGFKQARKAGRAR